MSAALLVRRAIVGASMGTVSSPPAAQAPIALADPVIVSPVAAPVPIGTEFTADIGRYGGTPPLRVSVDWYNADNAVPAGIVHRLPTLTTPPYAYTTQDLDSGETVFFVVTVQNDFGTLQKTSASVRVSNTVGPPPPPPPPDGGGGGGTPRLTLAKLSYDMQRAPEHLTPMNPGAQQAGGSRVQGNAGASGSASHIVPWFVFFEQYPEYNQSVAPVQVASLELQIRNSSGVWKRAYLNKSFPVGPGNTGGGDYFDAWSTIQGFGGVPAGQSSQATSGIGGGVLVHLNKNEYRAAPNVPQAPGGTTHGWAFHGWPASARQAISTYFSPATSIAGAIVAVRCRVSPQRIDGSATTPAEIAAARYVMDCGIDWYAGSTGGGVGASTYKGDWFISNLLVIGEQWRCVTGSTNVGPEASLPLLDGVANANEFRLNP